MKIFFQFYLDRKKFFHSLKKELHSFPSTFLLLQPSVVGEGGLHLSHHAGINQEPFLDRTGNVLCCLQRDGWPCDVDILSLVNGLSDESLSVLDDARAVLLDWLALGVHPALFFSSPFSLCLFALEPKWLRY